MYYYTVNYIIKRCVKIYIAIQMLHNNNITEHELNCITEI